MNFRYYKALKAIFDEGTISAAARRLNVSQPALSLTLKQFEDRLQYPLFRRVKKRLIPTNEALKLISASDEAFEAMDRLDRIARRLQPDGRQTLRIGVVQALAFEVVPSTIGVLLDEIDEYSFHVQTGTQRELRRELKSGLLDAIVMFGTTADPELHSQKIGECRAVIVLPKELDEVDGDGSVNLKELQLVDVLGSGPFGRFITEQLLSMSAQPSRVATETLYSALHFVEKNGFAAVLDEFSANLSNDTESEVRYLNDIDPFIISMVVRSSEQNTEVFVRFQQALSKTITGICNDRFPLKYATLV